MNEIFILYYIDKFLFYSNFSNLFNNYIINQRKYIFHFYKKKLLIIILGWSLLRLIKDINENIEKNDNIYLNDFILYVIKNFKEEKISIILTFFIIFMFFKIKIYYINAIFYNFISISIPIFSYKRKKRIKRKFWNKFKNKKQKN